MVHKGSFRLGLLLLLFLGFCLVLSSTLAVPTSRSLKSSAEEKASAVQDFLVQDEIFGMEERYVEGRMDLESTDYPGTGANNHHDPRTPGRG
ncbi:hypothetical protein K2173_025521 [Erythroxylum novogranatense]|uniref:Uncharacterized protein n=1 Tax=Erythroxylum novogranatense TaxID=1862640 RepID=A0AAV8T8J7_9ROSI|nr:hypothetical protein K2173_025521 [Erythroxylum novogranatense]